MLPKKLRSREKKAQLVAKLDWIFPKFSKKVVFVVKKNTEFSGNLRVCADLLLKKGQHKLYVYKDGTMLSGIKSDLSEQGIKVIEANRWLTFYHLLTSGVFVLSHVPRDAHLSLKHKRRKILGLWHGVAFKNIESQMLTVPTKKMELIKNNAKLYDLMVASSDADKKYIAKSFLVEQSIIEIIGLPRYELLKDTYPLGDYLLSQKNKLQKLKGSHTFVLYAPTFRENGKSAFDQINDDEWLLLNKFLIKNDVILALRPHSYDNKIPPKITQILSNIIWLSQEEFTESNLILQFTDILVVDFSSIWIDYLLFNRPIIGFAKDFEHYRDDERGFAYDFEATFPDVFTHNLNDLKNRLNYYLKNNKLSNGYQEQKKLFHKYELNCDFVANLAYALEKRDIL